MSVLYNLLIKTPRINLGVFKSTRSYFSFLSKTPVKKDALNVTKRHSSTHQMSSSMDVLQMKFAENNSKNILVYSCTSKGSLVINLMGFVACAFLTFAAYNSWYFLSSGMFKASSKSSHESSFFRKILDFLASESFRNISCILTVIVGNCFFLLLF